MDLVRQPHKHFTVGDFSRTAPPFELIRRARQPDIMPDRLLRLTVGLCLTAASVIFLSIAASRTRTPPTGLEIAIYLLPGHSLPNAASCNISDPAFRYILHCKAFQKGDDRVHFTYDRRLQVIRSLSRTVVGITLGDLILAWGTPSTYKYEYGTLQIYWEEKSAWLWTPLNPASPVSLVVYQLGAFDLPQDRLPWRGFRMMDNQNSRSPQEHNTH